MRHIHREDHTTHNIGWLRAAVLGANDGLLSTASLIIGVASAAAATEDIILAGTAGLVAGAMSMAAGEYVSVGSQSDAENANLAKERRELAEKPQEELQELADLFKARGVSSATALDVARQLTAHDALAAHAREELGLSEITAARPFQAAFTSAVSFAIGAGLPLGVVLIFPAQWLVIAVLLSSLVFLAALGGLGAKFGGAPPLKAAIRVSFWGAMAMAVSAGIGFLFNTSIG